MKVAVIGAGSWGTAIAQVVASSGHDALLWARREEVARALNDVHRNPDYLSDCDLHPALCATSSFARALEGAEAAAVVTPSNIMRTVAERMVGLVSPETPLVICSKGVEAGTGMLPVEVFADVLGTHERIAVLSGPNHAEEIVRGIPAATVVASVSEETAGFFQNLFASESLRVYTSDDVYGVELCAAFKNVIAIAVGVSYGLGYGDNTAAMLITRGMAEMGRLVTKAGGQPLTCMGLAGAGDLIATCMSQHSRNRRFGELVARGGTLEDFERATHMVAEGAFACRTLQTLAARYEVELPIADVVRDMVWEGVDPRTAERALVQRSLKPEFYGI